MTDLVIPPGKAKGCLPRASKVGEWCPLLSDVIDIIPREEWGQFIGEVELSSCVKKIKDQDGVGSCATESCAQGIEIVQQWQGQQWVELNPWFIYRVTSGGSDRGSNIDTNLRFARDNGCAPASLHPRSLGWRASPSAEAVEAAQNHKIDEFYDITSIDELGTALLTGFPVVFGWSGHSCIFTELLNANTAKYANSWAPTWGDNGFGTLALSRVNWGYGAYAIRTATQKEDEQ